jgi:hypothetical protein
MVLEKILQAKQFKRTSFKKLTNQKQELSTSAMYDSESGQNEQSL